MSPTAKQHLATMITSSFLQLYKTPWLLDLMTGDHIIFLKKPDDPGNVYMQFNDAFVMKRHTEDTRKGEHNLKNASFVRNPALVSLGILLSELHHGKTIDSCQESYERPYNDNENLFRASLTAQRLFMERNWLNKEYANAVQLCLCGDFAGPERDVTDETFRQEMYEKVVRPLEESIRRLTFS
ncbi:hypothetical protein CkaCkLH20_04687 [Colletotrichum karsti]|uniref:DUF7580 domain-containing protein n=1 Tax=Colletotrichum karsti TaxID=1095194 RepID=A0A9P6I8A1_9PEZI|nr:uncharacterized protein CkaCkLH20_04687 [Colletotrichum karsti]KAF9877552.1 hypothetical protein CkaCkLH20_04687 [Colletotrichum karsti]